ncbi:MAG: alpha/beta fold hydrolase [Gemmatimonadales bacterium]
MKRLPAALVALTACRADAIPPAERYPAGIDLVAREVVIDGSAIRYVETGRGPPVLLLHGFGASLYAWRHTIAPLAGAGFRVVAFDNRGFGFSDKPATGYANADYVRLVVTLLDSLGAAEATLVGHSMGGQIAAEVALAHPQRVRGVALLAASGLGVRQPLLLRVARWPVIGPLVSGLRSRGMTGRILRSTYADPVRVTEGDVDQYYAPVAAPDYGRSLRGVLREFRFDALVRRIDSLAVPALVLWGERDEWIPTPLGRRLASRVPRVAFFTVPGAGHALPEEAPDTVNRLLVTFLTEGLPRIPENLAWFTSSPCSRCSSLWTRPTRRRSAS